MKTMIYFSDGALWDKNDSTQSSPTEQAREFAKSLEKLLRKEYPQATIILLYPGKRINSKKADCHINIWLNKKDAHNESVSLWRIVSKEEQIK